MKDCAECRKYLGDLDFARDFNRRLVERSHQLSQQLRSVQQNLDACVKTTTDMDMKAKLLIISSMANERTIDPLLRQIMRPNG